VSLFRFFPSRVTEADTAAARASDDVHEPRGLMHRLKAFGRSLFGRRTDVPAEPAGFANRTDAPSQSEHVVQDPKRGDAPDLPPADAIAQTQEGASSTSQAPLALSAARSAADHSEAIGEGVIDRESQDDFGRIDDGAEAKSAGAKKAPIAVADLPTQKLAPPEPSGRPVVVARKPARKVIVTEPRQWQRVVSPTQQVAPSQHDAAPVSDYQAPPINHEALVQQAGPEATDSHVPPPALVIRPLKTTEIMRILRGDVSIAQDLAAMRRVDAADPAGDSALNIAARKGHGALCAALLAAGADIYLANKKGRTPRDLLQGSGQPAAPSNPRPASSSPRAWPDPSEATRDPIAAATPAMVEIDFELDDDDFVIGAQEEASTFHDRAGFAEAAATFDRVGPVARIDAGAGEEIAWASDARGLGIAGDGLLDMPERSVERDPEQRREANFLSVSRGKRSRLSAVAATTEGFLLTQEDCAAWLDEILERGCCTSQDVEALTSMCRGDFSMQALVANLSRELEACGLLVEGIDDLLDPVAPKIDAEALSEALSAAATRSNRVPGDKAFALTRRREQRLFADFHAARRAALNAIMMMPETRAIALSWADALLSWRSRAVESAGSFTPVAPDVEGELVFEAAASALAEGYLGDATVVLDALKSGISFFCTVEERCASEEVGQACRRLRHLYEDILDAHLPLARRMAARRTRDDEDVEDIFQDAFLGLGYALWRFDPDFGYRFMTFASFGIRQSILRQRTDFNSIVRFPAHRQELVNKLEALIEEHERIALPPPSPSQIAAALQIDEEMAEYLLRLPRIPVAFEEDFVELSQPDAFDEVLDRQRAERVAELLDGLDVREQDILRRRFGFGDDTPHTLEEIAETYGVTRERIRQIEAKALDKFGHPSRLRALRELL
jgi:RNA polymerase primary sigma factor